MKSSRLSSGERRSQIVSVAISLFARHGFNGVTTKKISAQAGVSEALLFKLFPTKSALYKSIIEFKIRQTLDEGMIFKRDDETYEEYFFRLSDSFIRMVDRDDTFMRILLFSALEGHQLSEIFFRERVTRNVRVIAKVISRGIKERVFKNIDPVISARMFMGLNFHYLQLKKIFKVTTPPLADGNVMSEAIVDLFMEGIKRRKK